MALAIRASFIFWRCTLQCAVLRSRTRGPYLARDLYVALVTPFSWSVPSAVNLACGRACPRTQVRGHLSVVVVSSDHYADERRLRALFHRRVGSVINLLGDYRQGGTRRPHAAADCRAGPLERETGIPVIPMGTSLPVRLGGGVTTLGLPIDMTSRLEKLMLGAEFDLVHVHEPLAPSLSFSALRLRRAARSSPPFT